MATEADKTETGVIATTFVVGAAVMIGGSAAIVALARTELDEVSRHNQVYADLQTVATLEAEQRQQLQTGKLPIERAKKEVLAAIQRSPRAASPAAAAPGATGEAETGAAGATGGAGGAEVTGTEREPTAGEAADQAGAATSGDKSAQEPGSGDKPLDGPAGEANTPDQAAPQGSAAPAGEGQQQ